MKYVGSETKEKENKERYWKVWRGKGWKLIGKFRDGKGTMDGEGVTGIELNLKSRTGREGRDGRIKIEKEVKDS